MATLQSLCFELRISPELFYLRRAENRNRFTAAFIFAGDLRIIIEYTTTSKTGNALLLQTLCELLRYLAEFFIRTEMRRIGDVERPCVNAVDGSRRCKTAVICPKNCQRCRNSSERQEQFFQAVSIRLRCKLLVLLGLQTPEKFHRRCSDAVLGFFSVGCQLVDNLRQQV